MLPSCISHLVVTTLLILCTAVERAKRWLLPPEHFPAARRGEASDRIPTPGRGGERAPRASGQLGTPRLQAY